MDVGSWLRNLGLGRYETAFVANAIDSDVIAELTELDLEKMGIPLGDRKRLMRAISISYLGDYPATVALSRGAGPTSAFRAGGGSLRRHPASTFDADPRTRKGTWDRTG